MCRIWPLPALSTTTRCSSLWIFHSPNRTATSSKRTTTLSRRGPPGRPRRQNNFYAKHVASGRPKSPISPSRAPVLADFAPLVGPTGGRTSSRYLHWLVVVVMKKPRPEIFSINESSTLLWPSACCFLSSNCPRWLSATPMWRRSSRPVFCRRSSSKSLRCDGIPTTAVPWRKYSSRSTGSWR